MSDLIRKGAQWLGQMRTTHCSSVVTYQRTGQPDLQVNATFGKTNYEVEDESGLTTGSHVWDFLITATALSGIEPLHGDVIVADGRRFEVLALGNDVKGWRWSDPYRQTYRIHTKDIGPPAPPNPPE